MKILKMQQKADLQNFGVSQHFFVLRCYVKLSIVAWANKHLKRFEQVNELVNIFELFRIIGIVGRLQHNLLELFGKKWVKALKCQFSVDWIFLGLRKFDES